ncbi:MAG: ABC transporter ATP-binding protein [Rhodobacteraceae bacterium]|nr:ABC transporter ATP-binding protein [Paracoccaceae bacterium]
MNARIPPSSDDAKGNTRPARLRVSGVSKQYPGCLANDDVSLDVRAGEILALLGENGAGKSTLIKVIYGLVAPDSGMIEIDGKARAITSPAAARAAGIGVVFQHFSLFESLTVAENIALGLDDAARRRDLPRRIRDIGERYGLVIDPDRVVADLSVGEQQRVEIVRVLLQDPSILIFDEPTSVLTPQAILGLFETLNQLRREGRAVIFISHKLEEIRTLCDRATVLRGGRVVGTVPVAGASVNDLARMMIGQEMPALGAGSAGQGGPVQLAAHNLSLEPANPHGTALDRLEMRARGGEILGIAGIAGNGQEELLAALSGERLTRTAGAVTLAGQAVGRLGPGARRKLGLGFVPGERLGRGAVPPMSLAENGFLTAHWRVPLTWRWVISTRKRNAFADRVIDEFRVATRSQSTAAQALSGGNLQRFIVGREILSDPRALVVAYPTWGVDVAAVAAIHAALVALRDKGAAVVVMSEDLDELLSLSDCVAVLYRGQLSAPIPRDQCTRENLGLLMSGAAPLDTARTPAQGDVDAA